jgi:uncharacterized RmlC-like cupin family protein
MKTGATQQTTDLREGVRVRRAEALAAERAAQGRTTVFDFAGIGSDRTWIGSVQVAPQASTGPHDHGRHEVMIYVVRGRSEIRWGARLDYAAEIGPGDCVYFTPGVPHQERSLETTEIVEYLVVRSDNETIAVKRPEIDPVAEPQKL